MNPKTTEPATTGVDGLRDFDQLARTINPNNNPSASTSQAPPGNRVESDFDFFRAHPNAQIRNRLPFPGEFAPAILAEGGGRDCFVRAIVERNSAGEPTRRARWLLFVEGGSA
jgi:hypothetical protein